MEISNHFQPITVLFKKTKKTKIGPLTMQSHPVNLQNRFTETGLTATNNN